jgi:hypothetical protein
MALQADVLGDREDPAGLETGNDPATQASQGVEEGELGRVLGFLATPELVEAVAEDAVVEPLVEALDMRIGRRRRCSGRDCASYRRSDSHYLALLGESSWDALSL